MLQIGEPFPFVHECPDRTFWVGLDLAEQLQPDKCTVALLETTYKYDALELVVAAIS